MELLKDRYFQAPFIQKLSEYLSEANDKFDGDKFKSLLLSEDYTSLELKEKLRICAETIGSCMNLDYEPSLDVILNCAPHFDDFDAMVFPEYVDVYGQDHFELSLTVLGQLTEFSSSEFAIRSYQLQDIDKVMTFMKALSLNKHTNIRRFSSEGSRPKLPWAIKVPALYEPENLLKIIEILDTLKEDDSLFVRKSVANTLNDISKIDPNLVIATAQKWINHHKHTDWILKHGLRTLLKKGNKDVLALWGLDSAEDVSVKEFWIDDNTSIGETCYVHVSFEVDNVKNIRGAYNVHYLKKNGSYSIKTFSFFEKEFRPGQYTMKKKISFKEMSTRKHYSGLHKIDMIINGDQTLTLDFNLK